MKKTRSKKSRDTVPLRPRNSIGRLKNRNSKPTDIIGRSKNQNLASTDCIVRYNRKIKWVSEDQSIGPFAHLWFSGAPPSPGTWSYTPSPRCSDLMSPPEHLHETVGVLHPCNAFQPCVSNLLPILAYLRLHLGNCLLQRHGRLDL